MNIVQKKLMIEKDEKNDMKHQDHSQKVRHQVPNNACKAKIVNEFVLIKMSPFSTLSSFYYYSCHCSV